MSTVRIVFFADTHLGFDFPVKPRIDRLRRGPDFFDNFRQVLDFSRKTRPDIVLHGGDLFFRAKVPQMIVDMVYSDLFEFAGEGIPIVIVPGNHERSILPTSLFLNHPNIFVFDRPQTFLIEVGGSEIALSGFPCQRKTVRDDFPVLLKKSGWELVDGGCKLLCLHQTVEDAKVGPSGYTFRKGSDVIRRRDLPWDAVAVLSGHIHRRQVLGEPTGGNNEIPPVIYPGSTERTSFAKKDEKKGFYEIEITGNKEAGWRIQRLKFIPLPARPMMDLFLEKRLQVDDLSNFIHQKLGEMDPNSIVRLRCDPQIHPEVKSKITSQFLRDIMPTTMNYQFSADFR
jgi:exonuclease SbcD